MKDKLTLAVIGYGCRGQVLVRDSLLAMCKNDVDIIGVCDVYEDRAKLAADEVEASTGKKPAWSTDYHDILKIDGLDAIIISTSWEYHVPIAVAAMEAGIYVGLEVGGAYSLEDCWKLVNTSERTGVQCMMLENCCYGRRELMVLNMVRQGRFGEVVFCTGAYGHDLRKEIAEGNKNRHYRLRNYLNRNCDNYPTHALGPIAKILNINRGNRFVTVSSMASCSKGMKEYLKNQQDADQTIIAKDFAQGDVIVTNIKCESGELISLTLDTTLPRSYSRGFTIQGTKGNYTEATDSVFIDGKHNEFDFTWNTQWGNAKEYEEEFDHPIWKEFHGNEEGGHGGMDWLVLRAFIESAKRNIQSPIDVYDTAAWMSISTLSEMSIKQGGTAIPVPDFTSGHWLNREDYPRQKYTLHSVEVDETVKIFPEKNV